MCSSDLVEFRTGIEYPFQSLEPLAPCDWHPNASELLRQTQKHPEALEEDVHGGQDEDRSCGHNEERAIVQSVIVLDCDDVSEDGEGKQTEEFGWDHNPDEF